MKTIYISDSNLL